MRIITVPGNNVMFNPYVAKGDLRRAQHQDDATSAQADL